MRDSRTLIDRPHAERMETESRDLFNSGRRQLVTSVGLVPRLLWCVFFPRKLLKLYFNGPLYRSVASSHNRVQFFCHPAGFKSARFLIGPLKMGFWLQLNDRM